MDLLSETIMEGSQPDKSPIQVDLLHVTTVNQAAR